MVQLCSHWPAAPDHMIAVPRLLKSMAIGGSNDGGGAIVLFCSNTMSADYAGVAPAAAPTAGLPDGLILCAATFLLLGVLAYTSHRCHRDPPPRPSAGEGSSPQEGLAAEALQSYPMKKYEELRRDGGAKGMACAICLADYKDIDPVRLLPNCGHVFHVKCVDSWLVLHASCPNCRSSAVFLCPVAAPPVGPR